MNPPLASALARPGAARSRWIRAIVPRVPMVACVVMTAVLCWWTWHRLTPEVQRRGKKVREHQQRLGEATDLRRRKRVAVEAKVSERHDALVERFFGDQENVLGWLREDVLGEASSLGLEMDPAVSASAEPMVLPGHTNTVFRVRFNIKARPVEGDGAGAYPGLLRLLDRLVDGERWCVVDAIRVRAQPDGLLRASIEMRAMGRPTPP